jgi:phosphopantothenoylcysteine decarboxylase
LLLAVSGSVATIKLPLIVGALRDQPNLSIRIISTRSAAHFLSGQSAEQPSLASLAAMPNVDGVYLDEHEWSEPWTRSAKILHIELRRWADVLVIAPMSANLLARVAGGLCDDLLASVIRAWDTARPIVAAPAMNQLMWEHPLTATHLAVIAQWSWFEILPPQVKALACGDVGVGGMREWPDIVRVIEAKVAALGDANAGVNTSAGAS